MEMVRVMREVVRDRDQGPALLHIEIIRVRVHPARERHQGAPSRGHAGHNTRCYMLGAGEALRSDRVGEWV